MNSLHQTYQKNLKQLKAHYNIAYYSPTIDPKRLQVLVVRFKNTMLDMIEGQIDELEKNKKKHEADCLSLKGVSMPVCFCEVEEDYNQALQDTIKNLRTNYDLIANDE